MFVFGLAKNDRENVDESELRVLRRAAGEMLNWDDEQVATMLASGAWTEVGKDGNAT